MCRQIHKHVKVMMYNFCRHKRNKKSAMMWKCDGTSCRRLYFCAYMYPCLYLAINGIIERVSTFCIIKGRQQNLRVP